VLLVDGVRKSFRHGPVWRRRGVPVLRGADLRVAPGELVGLVGENGSGKSTLLKIVVGMIDGDEGRLLRARRFGYCPQEALLWEKLAVEEHFALFAEAYGMERQAGALARETLLRELRFERYGRHRVGELSGGTAQKLNLALALMHDPDLLVLDEPYSGFDWETYLRFWDMADRRRAAGMGILVVSHMLTERSRLDRVYELREGRCEII